jgi:protein-tyrosine phosphatase
MDDSNLKQIKLEQQKIRINKLGFNKNYIDEIIPNLFLGDLHGALDNKNNFDLIINMSQHKYSTNAMIYDINIDDDPSVNIRPYLEQIIPLIEEALKDNKKVLVHCLMGKSRSASVILAYLIKNNKMTFEEAYKFINTKRKFPIEPNIGFIYQLKKYKTN